MNEFKDTSYVYGAEFDSLCIYKLHTLQYDIFYFNGGEIYDKDKNTIDQLQLVGIIKQRTAEFKEHMQRFERFVIQSEKIFENSSLASGFDKKYHIKKYYLKRLSSALGKLCEAIELTVNEQPHLRKKLKPLLYSARLFKSESAELIARIDDINSHIKSITADKITRNVYILTIMSALFLPLNLITGFFGMNTNKMFLNGQPNGTLIVACVICALTIFFALSWIIFQKNRAKL